MNAQLQTAFADASAITGATISNVGEAFAEQSFNKNLYASDLKHTSSAGTRLAAETIARTILSLQQ